MSESYKFPNQFIDTQFVPYMKKEEIESLVDSLADTVSKRYENRELVVLGVLKGASNFVADLVRKVRRVDMVIDFIKVCDLGRTRVHGGTIRIEKDIKVDIRDKDVLIVEDIVESARTLAFIKKRLELASPKSLEILTLFDRPFDRNEEIAIDYIGKTVKEKFIVGLGLDLEGYGRNLENIYYLKYPN
ncbi:MAG: hypoxanthine phosphoribosyltransferase [Bacteriovoracales bacterium]|nr:hypoxanthine phosphoribosyltransferase [Bacteriovoracales bacterium]